jgi:succinate-acetate transporter protein
MENIDWMSVVPAGVAIAILLGGLVMLFSGMWEARDK